MWAEAAIDDYVNAPPQKLLQVLPQPDMVEQAPARLQINEQIDITVRARIAASKGAEDADVPCPVACGDVKDLVAVLNE